MSEATYTEPDDTNPIGRFTCTHAHKEKRTANSLVEHLGLTVAAARTKPCIRVRAGELPAAVAAVERLLARDGSFFCSGNLLLRVIDRPGRRVVLRAG